MPWQVASVRKEHFSGRVTPRELGFKLRLNSVLIFDTLASLSASPVCPAPAPLSALALCSAPAPLSWPRRLCLAGLPRPCSSLGLAAFPRPCSSLGLAVLLRPASSFGLGTLLRPCSSLGLAALLRPASSLCLFALPRPASSLCLGALLAPAPFSALALFPAPAPLSTSAISLPSFLSRPRRSPCLASSLGLAVLPRPGSTFSASPVCPALTLDFAHTENQKTGFRV